MVLEAVRSHVARLGSLNILEATDFPSPEKALFRLLILFFTGRPVAASLARAYPKQSAEE